MNTFAKTILLVGVVALAACAQQPAQEAAPPDTRAADEATIRAAVKEWSAAAQAKDAAKFASFYAEDGVVMLEDMPDIAGQSAIHDALTGMMQDPNFALSFEAEQVVVARSGDLAYETGTYSMTMSGADQKPAPEKGHYIVVWAKQPDGAWRVVRDAPISDPPEPATTPGG